LEALLRCFFYRFHSLPTEPIRPHSSFLFFFSFPGQVAPNLSTFFRSILPSPRGGCFKLFSLGLHRRSFVAWFFFFFFLMRIRDWLSSYFGCRRPFERPSRSRGTWPTFFSLHFLPRWYLSSSSSRCSPQTFYLFSPFPLFFLFEASPFCMCCSHPFFPRPFMTGPPFFFSHRPFCSLSRLPRPEICLSPPFPS